jgi:hypothetical protein
MLTHKQAWMAAVFGIGATTLFAAAAQAQSFPVAAGDDITTSLGSFRIVVRPQFQPLMAGYPGYNPGTHRLQSPILSDQSTSIGRSAAMGDGSALDTGGIAVGTAGTLVKDSDMTILPGDFVAVGPGNREVHTDVAKFDLAGSGAHVRAGTASDRPLSPGEVQSKANNGVPANDFPAQSFFDIFVDVDLPGLPGGTATLINNTPLLVENTNLTNPPGLPPKVIYIHGNSTAVPILFQSDNPGFWHAGDVFGDLVLAGHGEGYNINNGADVAQFQTFMNSQQEIPVAEPEPSSLAVMAIGLSVGGVWMRRRRRVG